MSAKTTRTDRNGVRTDVTTIPRGTSTLPPLPSLQEPLYVIGEILKGYKSPHSAETDIVESQRHD